MQVGQQQQQGYPGPPPLYPQQYYQGYPSYPPPYPMQEAKSQGKPPTSGSFCHLLRESADLRLQPLPRLQLGAY